MTQLLLSAEVREASWSLRIDAVVASGFDGYRPWPDCYNLVSASYGVPAGAFDLSATPALAPPGGHAKS
jgi:hypothetical protein